MAREKCYHCPQFLTHEERKTHDCWTTTAENLTRDLPEDLLDAWLKIRETVSEFGEQRSYASHKSIMFSRKSCYAFVRPKKKVLEVIVFLGRKVSHPLVKGTYQTSRVKTAHTILVTHSDQIESPLTDWLSEAYTVTDDLRLAKGSSKKKKSRPKRKSKPMKKTKAKNAIKAKRGKVKRK